MGRHFLVLAGALLVIGVAGLVAPNPLAGLLETTPLLNSLHCAAAVLAAAAAARGIGAMRTVGQILGFSFATLATTAFATDAGFVSGLLPLTTSNAWLHLLFALAFLYYALLAPPTL